MRSAVIIVEQNQLALIRRVRAGQTFHIFPGGTIEPGETAEAAAIREAYEELGVYVQLQRLAAVSTFHRNVQFYYYATITAESAGQFGTGTGEEYNLGPSSSRGSYQPVWLGLNQLAYADVRPHALARALADGSLQQMTEPLQIQETR